MRRGWMTLLFVLGGCATDVADAERYACVKDRDCAAGWYCAAGVCTVGPAPDAQLEDATVRIDAEVDLPCDDDDDCQVVLDKRCAEVDVCGTQIVETQLRGTCMAGTCGALVEFDTRIDCQGRCLMEGDGPVCVDDCVPCQGEGQCMVIEARCDGMCGGTATTETKWGDCVLGVCRETSKEVDERDCAAHEFCFERQGFAGCVESEQCADGECAGGAGDSCEVTRSMCVGPDICGRGGVTTIEAGICTNAGCDPAPEGDVEEEPFACELHERCQMVGPSDAVCVPDPLGCDGICSLDEEGGDCTGLDGETGRCLAGECTPWKCTDRACNDLGPRRWLPDHRLRVDGGTVLDELTGLRYVALPMARNLGEAHALCSDNAGWRLATLLEARRIATPESVAALSVEAGDHFTRTVLDDARVMGVELTTGVVGPIGWDDEAGAICVREEPFPRAFVPWDLTERRVVFDSQDRPRDPRTGLQWHLPPGGAARIGPRSSWVEAAETCLAEESTLPTVDMLLTLLTWHPDDPPIGYWMHWDGEVFTPADHLIWAADPAPDGRAWAVDLASGIMQPLDQANQGGEATLASTICVRAGP